ncbi:MAG: hypothetical protein EA356_06435 [Geminicoccaceae bacterium]|nr:MAG: hypothetical protein EA356_06435 [Geminicoccaceae bacterium]
MADLPEGDACLDPAKATAPELMAIVRSALANPAGSALMSHLQRRFADRVLPPTASDAELRHLEGQRSVVAYLRHLVAISRRAPSGEFE